MIAIARKAHNGISLRRRRSGSRLESVARARTIWEEGDAPARVVALLGVVTAATLLVLDLLLTSSVSLVFDIGYVLLCVVLALWVRPRDFTIVTVLPPTLMVGLFWIHAALSAPSTVQGLVRTVSEHVGALAVGYVLFLAILLVRHEFLQRREERSRR